MTEGCRSFYGLDRVDDFAPTPYISGAQTPVSTERYGRGAGWVPTRMGGAGAPDDLTKGHLTQTWLAVSDDSAARVSGGYWYHRKRQRPAADALDPAFHDRLTAKLAELAGLSLF
jgi:hypothetical protein